MIKAGAKAGFRRKPKLSKVLVQLKFKTMNQIAKLLIFWLLFSRSLNELLRCYKCTCSICIQFSLDAALATLIRATRSKGLILDQATVFQIPFNIFSILCKSKMICLIVTTYGCWISFLFYTPIFWKSFLIQSLPTIFLFLSYNTIDKTLLDLGCWKK